MRSRYKANNTYPDPSCRWCPWGSTSSICLLARRCQISQRTERHVLADLDGQYALQCPVQAKAEQLRDEPRSAVVSTDVAGIRRTIGTRLRLTVRARTLPATQLTHNEAVREFMFGTSFALLHVRAYTDRPWLYEVPSHASGLCVAPIHCTCVVMPAAYTTAPKMVVAL